MSSDTPWTAQRYVVVDVEGNGAHPPDLVELAIVPIGGGIIGEPQSWLVRPDTPITWQARRVHGITNEDATQARPFNAIRDEVQARLTDAVIVGQNVRIDLDVLDRKLPDWQPNSTLDTLRLARALLPELSSHKLGALVDHYDLANGLPAGLHPHRATYDALVTARLLLRLATNDDGTPRSAEDLRELGGPPLKTRQPDTRPKLF